MFVLKIKMKTNTTDPYIYVPYRGHKNKIWYIYVLTLIYVYVYIESLTQKILHIYICPLSGT